MKGIIARKISDILRLMRNDMNTERIIISGVLTAILISIWKAICSCDTSLVSLVTRDELENLSTSSKEKSRAL